MDGQIVQRVAGTCTDLTVGARISVMGQQNDTTVTATRVDIVPAMVPQS